MEHNEIAFSLTGVVGLGWLFRELWPMLRNGRNGNGKHTDAKIDNLALEMRQGFARLNSEITDLKIDLSKLSR